MPDSLFTAAEWRILSAKLKLSPRQLAVLIQIFASKSDDEIAISLGISDSTVRTYVNRMQDRLQVEGRVGLVVHVLRVFLGR